MGKVRQTARKAMVGLVGFPLLIVGIILVPLPGPGLITCFIAFLVLSLGFNWAERYLDEAKQNIGRIYAKAKARADRIENIGNKDSSKQP